MDPQKAAYIQRIRSQTAYPSFRGFVGIVAMLCNTIAGLLLIGSIVNLVRVLPKAVPGPDVTFAFAFLFVGLIASGLLPILGAVLKEGSLMLVDVADSITDLNSRYEQQ